MSTIAEVVGLGGSFALPAKNPSQSTNMHASWFYLQPQLTLSKYSSEPFGSGLIVGESGVQFAGHTWRIRVNARIK